MADLRVFFGHHKCGSRFLRQTVLEPMAQAANLESIGYKIKQPPFHFRLCHELDLKNLPFGYLGQCGPALLKISNTSQSVRKKLDKNRPEYKALRVIRDPRQVLLSNYYHHRHGHNLESPLGWVWDQLKEDRPVLQALNLEEGILYEMGHITADIFKNQLYAWKPDPRVLEIRLEDFGHDPMQQVHKIASHLDLTVPDEFDLSRTYANPESQSWEYIFSARIKAAFKERHGQLLIDLGYETGLDW